MTRGSFLWADGRSLLGAGANGAEAIESRNGSVSVEQLIDVCQIRQGCFTRLATKAEWTCIRAAPTCRGDRRDPALLKTTTPSSSGAIRTKVYPCASVFKSLLRRIVGRPLSIGWPAAAEIEAIGGSPACFLGAGCLALNSDTVIVLTLLFLVTMTLLFKNAAAQHLPLAWILAAHHSLELNLIHSDREVFVTATGAAAPVPFSMATTRPLAKSMP